MFPICPPQWTNVCKLIHQAKAEIKIKSPMLVDRRHDLKYANVCFDSQLMDPVCVCHTSDRCADCWIIQIQLKITCFDWMYAKNVSIHPSRGTLRLLQRAQKPGATRISH